MKRSILLLLFITGLSAMDKQPQLLPGVQEAVDLMLEGKKAEGLKKADEQLMLLGKGDPSLVKLNQVRPLLYYVFLPGTKDDVQEAVLESISTKIQLLMIGTHILVAKNKDYAHTYAFDLGAMQAKSGSLLGAQSFVNMIEVENIPRAHRQFAKLFLLYMVKQYHAPRALAKLLHFLALDGGYAEFAKLTADFDSDILLITPREVLYEYIEAVKIAYDTLGLAENLSLAVRVQIQIKHVEACALEAKVQGQNHNDVVIKSRVDLVKRVAEQTESTPAKVEASLTYIEYCLAVKKYKEAYSCARAAVQALQGWKEASSWALLKSKKAYLFHIYNYLSLYSEFTAGKLALPDEETAHKYIFQDPAQALRQIGARQQDFRTWLTAYCKNKEQYLIQAPKEESKKDNGNGPEMYSEAWFREVD